MNSIRNKKYWLSIYLGLILSLSVLITVTILYLTGVILPGGTIILPFVLILYGIFIFFYFKKVLNTWKIELTNYEIILARKNELKKIRWSEILNIDNSERNGFLGMETIKIILKNQRNPILLYHSHYSNSNVLTQAINYCYNLNNKGVMADLASFTPIILQPINSNDIKYENINYISRFPLTTFRSYFPLLGIFGIYKLVTVEIIPTIGIAMILCLVLLTFIVGIVGIGKIGLSEKYLVIQNYYFPFERIFRLNEIQEVFIEFPGYNSANAIRVITNDGKQKTLQIANYLKKDWLLLEKLLVDKNIRVNNTLCKT